MYDYVDASPLRRSVRRLVTTRPVAWCAVRFLPGLDRQVYRVTRGRQTLSAWVTGLPVVVLITQGARTGQRRETRVLGVRDGDALVVIAANFGETSNPAWYYNVPADPRVAVVVDGSERMYRAHEVAGAQRDRLFERAVAMNPGWVQFRRRARDRAIPVLRLEPEDGSVVEVGPLT